MWDREASQLCLLTIRRKQYRPKMIFYLIMSSWVPLEFEVTLRPTLTAEERDPFATAYLTSDLESEPQLFQTESFGRRLLAQKTQQRVDRRTSVSFVARFRVRAPGPRGLAADAALCVQCFCELPNHKDERCSHRCGFAAFALRGMAAAAATTTFSARMRDNGPSRDGRGVAEARALNPEAIARLFSAAAAPPPALLVGAVGASEAARALEVSSRYHAAVDDLLGAMRPTDEAIRVPRLPIYVLSGGMTMPSCAFIMFRSPPAEPEEFHENALAVALRRALPWVASDGERADAFCDDGAAADWNWKASVLMDAATLLPASVPYLYDSAISCEGAELVAAEEFVRTGALTLTIDCEDGSVMVLVFLWHALVDAPRTRCMRMAQRVRAQYVVTLCLKSVTRPSQSNGNGCAHPPEAGLAAHACCDMVPIRALESMLGSEGGSVIRAIAEERSALLLPESVAARLRVVVGETTGYVQSHVTAPASSEARAAAKAIARPFRAARLVAAEDLAAGSTFYRYAASALVHDTLISPAARRLAEEAGAAWLVPQIVYALRRPGLTYGAPHAAYVAASPDVVAYAVGPLTRQVADVIARLAKFEHPVPPLGAPRPPVESPSWGAATRAAGAINSDARWRRRRAPAAREDVVTVCVPLRSVTDDSARELARAMEACSPSLAGARAFVEAVTDDVATLVLRLDFSRAASI